MPTVAEKQALVFLSAVALMGGSVRVWQNRQSEAQLLSASHAGGEDVSNQLAAVDGARFGKRDKTRSRRTPHIKTPRAPKPHAEPSVPAVIDVDIASAEELESLPGVGPALAARIITNRDSLGQFGSINELARVHGLSKSVLSAIALRVTFSGRQPRDAYKARGPKSARGRSTTAHGRARLFPRDSTSQKRPGWTRSR